MERYCKFLSTKSSSFIIKSVAWMTAFWKKERRGYPFPSCRPKIKTSKITIWAKCCIFTAFITIALWYIAIGLLTCSNLFCHSRGYYFHKYHLRESRYLINLWLVIIRKAFSKQSIFILLTKIKEQKLKWYIWYMN